MAVFFGETVIFLAFFLKKGKAKKYYVKKV